MSESSAVTVLQIVRLDNGDIVLVEGEEPATEAALAEPIVSIRFAAEVQDMLGDDSLIVAEAMLDAATELIYADGGGQDAPDGDAADGDAGWGDGDSGQPVVVH